MTYEIRKHSWGYNVIDKESNAVLRHCDGLDEANRIWWLNRDPDNRYQIVANSWSRKKELTWYHEQDDGLVIPNGSATIEEARLAIVEDLQEVCGLNGYATHPNPEGDYSIIDTFTGEEVDYSITEEEARHPDPDFKPEIEVCKKCGK